MTQTVTDKKFLCFVKQTFKRSNMKKTLTFSNSAMPAQRTLPQVSLKRALNAVLRAAESSVPVVKLAALYSKLLEEPVTPRRTLHFINAQLSAFMLVCASAESTGALVALAAWTGAAIYGCRKR